MPSFSVTSSPVMRAVGAMVSTQRTAVEEISDAGRNAAMPCATLGGLVRRRAAVSGRVASGPSQLSGDTALPWRSAMIAKVRARPCS